MNAAGSDVQLLHKVVKSLPTWAKQCRIGGAANYELEVVSRVDQLLIGASLPGATTLGVEGAEKVVLVLTWSIKEVFLQTTSCLFHIEPRQIASDIVGSLVVYPVVLHP